MSLLVRVVYWACKNQVVLSVLIFHFMFKNIYDWICTNKLDMLQG